jgi:non-ribosomal peptide synthetase component F
MTDPTGAAATPGRRDSTSRSPGGPTVRTPHDPNGDHMPESSPEEAATPHDDAQRVLGRADAVTPPRTLVDVLRATVAAHPDASAIQDGDGALSYRELMAPRAP